MNRNLLTRRSREWAIATACHKSLTCHWFATVMYETTQKVGKAKIAGGVEVREEEGTEDAGRCCRGGGSGQ